MKSIIIYLSLPFIEILVMAINIIFILALGPYLIYKEIESGDIDLQYEGCHYMIIVYFLCPIIVNSVLLISLLKNIN